MRKRISFVLVLVMVMCVFAACDRKKTPSAAPTATPSVSNAPTNTPSAEPTATPSAVAESKITVSELLKTDGTIFVRSEYDAGWSTYGEANFSKGDDLVKEIYSVQNGQLNVYKVSDEIKAEDFLKKSKADVDSYLKSLGYENWPLDKLHYVFYSEENLYSEENPNQEIEEVVIERYTKHLLDDFLSIRFGKKTCDGNDGFRGYCVIESSIVEGEADNAGHTVSNFHVYGNADAEFVLDKSADVQGITSEEMDNIYLECLSMRGYRYIGEAREDFSIRYGVGTSSVYYDGGYIFAKKSYKNSKDTRISSLVSSNIDINPNCDMHMLEISDPMPSWTFDFAPANGATAFYSTYKGFYISGEGKHEDERGVYYEKITGSLGSFDLGGKVNVQKQGGWFPCTFGEDAKMFDGQFICNGIDVAKEYMAIYDYAKEHKTEAKEWNVKIIEDAMRGKITLNVALTPETSECEAYLSYSVEYDLYRWLDSSKNVAVESCTGAPAKSAASN